ncbi:3-hydroxyacyl-CoA dehydrogenase [Kerstersia similis]
MVKQVAVLGAGVMGAQIAAHFANAGVSVLLYDLTAKEGERSGIAARAIANLARLQPAPLAEAARAGLIQPANYEDDLVALTACDLVVEAIAERLDWKRDLYHRVAPHVADHAVFATNTSGLSINTLADAVPASLRSRFCGVHFFNPPRYMRLVELIAARETDAGVLDGLESWLTTRLGKGVVRALDTPNFIGNRIGIFAMLAALHHAEAMGLTPDEVDAITGPAIGRPKSATYRTADVIGLDTFAHVVATMDEYLPQDPWHRYFQLPVWMQALIQQGALGQKSGAGVYRKEGRVIQVLDTRSGKYREGAGAMSAVLADILKVADPVARMRALRESDDVQARFLWSIFRDVFHYSAYHLADVAHCARDLDLTLRWGFAWAQGPFETWQQSDWQATAQAIAADIGAGRALVDARLPDWVLEPARQGVHQAQGSYGAGDGRLHPRSTLPVYRRQCTPELLAGESQTMARTLHWENEGVSLWSLDELDARIAVVSFKSRMHAVGEEVLDGLLQAIARAERDFDGLVLWHPAPFSVGANLKQLLALAQDGQFAEVDSLLQRFQQVSLALQYAQVPTIAAVEGMALGGGCEFAVHAARRVLALETSIGLVETGVGLIPAGGGCVYVAQRAALLAATADATGTILPHLRPLFQNVAQARASRSAWEAQTLGYARHGDTVLFHPAELLYAGIQAARGLAESGYAPPPRYAVIPVAGQAGLDMLETELSIQREAGRISNHDYRVALGVATVLCGGLAESGTQAPVAQMLAAERRVFIELLRTPETQARIAHTLKTGKPLRN